jgi:hypothetical protein
LKRLSNEERLRLQNEIETWYIEIERLENIAKVEGHGAVTPGLKYH